MYTCVCKHISHHLKRRPVLLHHRDECIYIYIHTDTYTRTHVYVCLHHHFERRPVLLHHRDVCIYIYIHTYTYTWTHVYKCMMYVYIYTYIHIHTHVHMCMYINITIWNVGLCDCITYRTTDATSLYSCATWLIHMCETARSNVWCHPLLHYLLLYRCNIPVFMCDMIYS